MAHTLCVCSGSLPFRIQPALVNQVVLNDQSTYFVHTSDGFVSTVYLDVNSGTSIPFLFSLREVNVLSSLPCVDVCSMKEPAIHAVLQAYQVVITVKGKARCFPLNYPASWVRIYPYNRSSDRYVVFAFGSFAVSAFVVSQNGNIEEHSPLILNSRISVLDYVDGVLAVAMIGEARSFLLIPRWNCWAVVQGEECMVLHRDSANRHLPSYRDQHSKVSADRDEYLGCCCWLFQLPGTAVSFSSSGEREL